MKVSPVPEDSNELGAVSSANVGRTIHRRTHYASMNPSRVNIHPVIGQMNKVVAGSIRAKGVDLGRGEAMPFFQGSTTGCGCGDDISEPTLS